MSSSARALEFDMLLMVGAETMLSQEQAEGSLSGAAGGSTTSTRTRTRGGNAVRASPSSVSSFPFANDSSPASALLSSPSSAAALYDRSGSMAAASSRGWVVVPTALVRFLQQLALDAYVHQVRQSVQGQLLPLLAKIAPEAVAHFNQARTVLRSAEYAAALLSPSFSSASLCCQSCVTFSSPESSAISANETATITLTVITIIRSGHTIRSPP